MSKTIEIYGIRVSVETGKRIKQAGQRWKERDTKSWQFAGDAYDIVGTNEIGATKALAYEMNVESETTPQGYAKAWEIKLDLHIIDHIAPLDGLFISHYITVGKAYHAGNISLENADILLREASKFRKPVTWIRAKLRGKMGDDSWRASQEKIIETIKAHTINAPYTGVHEDKASIAAWVGRVFVKVLEWALNDKPFLKSDRLTSDILKSELQYLMEIFDMDQQEERE